MRRCLLTASCMLWLAAAVSAQYRGGSGDGAVLATSSSSVALGLSIFRGGIDDGNSLAVSASALALGLSIFHGGTDDGWGTSASVNPLSLGYSIFKGGVDDGTTVSSSASATALGLSIFHGGIDDGTTMSTSTSSVPLGMSIYKGGADDGWAVSLATTISLPVTIISFTAKWQQEDVLTSWKTSSESNTDHFEIERSIDGLAFSTVATTAAAGNSSTKQDYQFLDKKVNKNYSIAPSKIYYRLKTVDKDGKITYSAVVVITNGLAGNTTLYTLYPNPSNQQLAIEMQGSFRVYVLTLLNGAQQLLLQKKVVNQKEIISVAKYPAGIYYIVITDAVNNATQTFKILIQH